MGGYGLTPGGRAMLRMQEATSAYLRDEKGFVSVYFGEEKSTGFVASASVRLGRRNLVVGFRSEQGTDSGDVRTAPRVRSHFLAPSDGLMRTGLQQQRYCSHSASRRDLGATLTHGSGIFCPLSLYIGSEAIRCRRRTREGAN